MATTDEHLPEDIIVQILYRLPVKPIVRFKCVSKRWCSIVSAPQFTKSQFKFASERKTLSHRLLLSTCSQLESFDLQTPSFRDDASVRKLAFPFKQPERAVKILGSCNGMVFVATESHYHDNSYIWNPTTGLLLKLPNPSYRVGSCPAVPHCGCPSYMDGMCPVVPHCGFGYVSATDDYKVVVAGSFRNSTVPVEIYSSKANSWKRIESQPLFSSDKGFAGPEGTFSNEALHWLFASEKPTIIAFDLVKEKFRERPLPLLKEDGETNNFLHDMGVVSGGCLCVASYDEHDSDGEIIQLWVMMDYDVCESWTKLVKLVDYRVRPPFVYWERSVVLFSDDIVEEIQELVRFDHKEGDKLDKVAVCSGRYVLERGNSNMIEYDESLLWLHDYQGEQGKR
ncbi:hypothetical protein M0R45_004807 [Rubus argutus]|uniref:F-box domain-containing protein n=1 Tax=Rubus argutus TaxID=59490 RepID=A0AAW1YKY2_RUBAR